MRLLKIAKQQIEVRISLGHSREDVEAQVARAMRACKKPLKGLHRRSAERTERHEVVLLCNIDVIQVDPEHAFATIVNGSTVLLGYIYLEPYESVHVVQSLINNSYKEYIYG